MRTILTIFLILFTPPIFAQNIAMPDCTGIENYPASMAFVHLKNAGITSNDKIDFSRTTVSRLASEKKEHNVFQQVHLVAYQEKSGKKFSLITFNDVSSEECSMSQAEVYLIDRRLDK
ncbi:MAG: hypothetical protein OEZ43_17410 [Gammaproteobacteria bacterium]|nr:hypothetical protein [Gammaproteobacteria bacterium]